MILQSNIACRSIFSPDTDTTIIFYRQRIARTESQPTIHLGPIRRIQHIGYCSIMVCGLIYHNQVPGIPEGKKLQGFHLPPIKGYPSISRKEKSEQGPI